MEPENRDSLIKAISDIMAYEGVPVQPYFVTGGYLAFSEPVHQSVINRIMGKKNICQLMDMRFYRYILTYIHTYIHTTQMIHTYYPDAEVFSCLGTQTPPFIFKENGESVAAAMPMLLTAATEPYQPYIDELEKIVAETLDKDAVE